MEWAIKAEQLGKDYVIRHESTPRYVALRDVISERVRGLLGGHRSKLLQPKTREKFAALNGVSFEIAQGQRRG